MHLVESPGTLNFLLNLLWPFSLSFPLATFFNGDPLAKNVRKTFAPTAEGRICPLIVAVCPTPLSGLDRYLSTRPDRARPARSGRIRWKCDRTLGL